METRRVEEENAKSTTEMFNTDISWLDFHSCLSVQVKDRILLLQLMLKLLLELLLKLLCVCVCVRTLIICGYQHE